MHKRCTDVPLCAGNVSALFAHTNARTAVDDVVERSRRWPKAFREICLIDGRWVHMLYARLRVHKRCTDVPLCVRNVSAHFAHTNARTAPAPRRPHGPESMPRYGAERRPFWCTCCIVCAVSRSQTVRRRSPNVRERLCIDCPLISECRDAPVGLNPRKMAPCLGETWSYLRGFSRTLWSRGASACLQTMRRCLLILGERLRIVCALESDTFVLNCAIDTVLTMKKRRFHGTAISNRSGV